MRVGEVNMQIYYIHTDHQGSVIAITDADGDYMDETNYPLILHPALIINRLAKIYPHVIRLLSAAAPRPLRGGERLRTEIFSEYSFLDFLGWAQLAC